MTSRSFSAFQAPGYRWLLANSFSMSAAWTAEGIGQGWLVLQLTNSPFWIGVVIGLRGVVSLLSSVVGGTVADRLDRRWILVTSHSLAALLTLGMAALIWTDAIRLWHILLYTAVSGAMGSVNAPTFSALTYDVVGPTRLLNANAFRFMAGSVVRIASALAGGVIIDVLGIAPDYLLVSGAYIAAAVALLPLRPPRGPRDRPQEGPARALWAGFRYAVRTRPVRALLLLSLVTEAFGFSHLYMKPVMARDVLQVGATGLGLLEAAGAAGQLLAMVLLASLGDFRRKEWLLLGGSLGFGLSIALFGLSPWFAVSLILVAFVGACSSTYDSTMSTVLQTTASSEMRGRTLGLYVSTWGSNQIGGFVLGALGTLIGVPLALAASGTVVAVNALRLLPQAKAFSQAQQAGAPQIP